MKKYLIALLFLTVAFGQTKVFNSSIEVKGDIRLEGSVNDANEVTITAPTVTGDRTITIPDKNLDLDNLVITSVTASGNIGAATFTGDGSALTGIASGTGGVTNTGSTTIGADTDGDGSGEIAFQIGGSTVASVSNDGYLESNNWELLTDYNGSLSTAISTIGATVTTLIINMTPDTLTANLTIPATLDLLWLRGNVLEENDDTLSFNYGSSIQAGDYQLFNEDMVIDGTIQGEFNAKWYGATGDGSTDDTATLQAAIDLLKSKTVSSMFVPAGVYNFTTLTFYDATMAGDLRGNFVFRGELAESYLKRVGDLGTLFNCTSTSGDAFVINKYTGAINQGMSEVLFKDFRVDGSTTGSLVVAEWMKTSSKIDNININNDSTGVGLRVFSAPEAIFSNIYVRGRYEDIQSGSIGIWYNTDTHTGVTGIGGGRSYFEEINVQWFDKGMAYEPDTLALNTAGLSNGYITNAQFHYCNTGVEVGHNPGHLVLENVVFELDSVTAINISSGTHVTLNNIGISAMAGSHAITFENSDVDSTIYSGPKLVVNGGRIRGATDSSIIVIPDSSYASLTFRDVEFYGYNNDCFVFGDTYFGRFVLDNIDYFNFTEDKLTNHKEFISPSSNLPKMASYTINSDTLDLSYRPYAPSEIIAVASGSPAVIYLPSDEDALELQRFITITTSNATDSIFIDAGSGNTIYKSNSSAQLDTLVTSNRGIVYFPTKTASSIRWVKYTTE